jgi:hypothetical protein
MGLCAENILFSLPYDEDRYRLTLEVCALVSDLEIIEDGDEAEIGERGVSGRCLSRYGLLADPVLGKSFGRTEGARCGLRRAS